MAICERVGNLKTGTSSGEVRKAGLINRLRAAGQALLPKGRFRSFANSLLVAIEKRRGRPYIIAGHKFRFLPSSEPNIPRPDGSEHEHYDAIQLALFAATIRAGDVIADVGAYRGEYAVPAAALVGDGGHVVAFEPLAANIEFIRRNLAHNALTARATLVQKAVAAEPGTATFYTAGASSQNSTLRGAIAPDAADSVTELRVEVTSLDAFYRDFGRMPSVVKIDIEGAEFAALRGAEAIVRSDATVFCELHPYAWAEAGHTGDELRDWLRARGRRIVQLASDDDVTEWKYGPVRLLRID